MPSFSFRDRGRARSHGQVALSSNSEINHGFDIMRKEALKRELVIGTKQGGELKGQLFVICQSSFEKPSLQLILQCSVRSAS